MEWMSLNTLREKYLSFFESKGHLRLGSFSLVPNNDKSLLLINSGMAPMKKYFTGEVTPPSRRVTTCQKCIRTPDLERVGHTARHGTYFEMLGNFSFGDYFKEEAITWAWEFLTEVLGIDSDRLWPSIYESDDEAYSIWRNKIGVPQEHIVRLGKADNFWEHGTGPCGPCSEIYFDRGEKYGCGSPDCKPGCDCDRYMEIWNNVFSQFNNMGDGTYTELEQKNIDTGMGLERLACIMQDVDNMFEVDTIRNILNKVCELSGKNYGGGGDSDISIRAITDHSRAATFMISDGIIPSNEGRGYVLRRLIRRAARHGKLIGISGPFLTILVDAVINENKSGYPELEEKAELIKKVISFEEAAFAKTIDQGLKMLSELTKSGEMLLGDDAFKLYDTYGFPLDLTKDILSEQNMTLDEERFNELMTQQRETARSGRKSADSESWKSDSISFEGVEATEFDGYTNDSVKATVVALISNGEQVTSAQAGSRVVVALDRTVFYAESGGQVGDQGTIKSSGAVLRVDDTVKSGNGIYNHIAEVESGVISVGDSVIAEIDAERRNAIRRNHTAAHLLQWALRNVLGTHVEQAGQLVNDSEVRFDFTHFSAMTDDEIRSVERMVNDIILSCTQVKNEEMPIEEAKNLGAMALFGEKYGDVVRVVNIDGSSVELCGGTHVGNTGKLGLFRIVSESSVAAGVRRIQAVTGYNVLNMLDRLNDIINITAVNLKIANPAEIANRAKQVMEELKENEKALKSLEDKLASGKLDAVMKKSVNIGDVSFVSALVDGSNADEIRSMCEKIKDNNAATVAVLAAVGGGKITFCASASKSAVKIGLNAGEIVREVARITGGNGGGKPDLAMAGGKDQSKIDDALFTARELIKAKIGD